MKSHSVRPLRREKPVRPLSDEELGKFLKNLAVFFKDKRTGNRPLAEALIVLADRLLSKSSSRESLDAGQLTGEGGQLTRDEQSHLRLGLGEPAALPPSVTMSAADVARMVSDQSRTKQQLIELAAVRFSIPKSKLLRLTINDVREAIRSALIHEGSLAAISEAAERYGSRRQS